MSKTTISHIAWQKIDATHEKFNIRISMNVNKFRFFVGGLLLVLSLIDSNYSNALEKSTPESASLAISSIREAESAGAEVSGLISRFNIAMNILEQGEASTFDSCSSYDECINISDGMFMSVVNDAMVLKERANSVANEEMISNILYAIIGAFAISFLSVYLYRLWRNYQLRRFLRLEIEETR